MTDRVRNPALDMAYLVDKNRCKYVERITLHND